MVGERQAPRLVFQARRPRQTASDPQKQTVSAQVMTLQAHGGVGFDSHGLQCVEELLALADEQPAGSEGSNSSPRAGEPIGQRTNDRDLGQVWPEFDRYGEDEARLNQGIERAEEIGECQAGYGVRKWRHRGLHSVPRKIHPFQKVSDLVSTNTKGDLEHLRIRHFLTHGCIKTRSALLNLSEMKGRYIRDRLDVIVARKVGVGSAVEIAIGSGNGGNPIERDRLSKGGAEVRIGCTAVTNKPAGVDIEMHEVCEAQLAGGSHSCAPRQSCERGKVDRFRSSELEIGIEERSVAHFIQRVAGNILRAIAIKVRQCDLIGVQRFVRVHFNGWKIADTTQFRILYPKI